jgi:hypothetical protein
VLNLSHKQKLGLGATPKPAIQPCCKGSIPSFQIICEDSITPLFLNKIVKTFLESFYNTQELLPDTSFEDVQNMDSLKVYRSSARSFENDYTSGSHAGTKQQALIRADYMVNDEEKYEQYYLYELIVQLGNVYPSLLTDDGSDHGYDYVSDMKNYDTAFYKNTGEGNIRNENLSIIIINPAMVIKSQMVSVLTKDELLAMQNELYK